MDLSVGRTFLYNLKCETFIVERKRYTSLVLLLKHTQLILQHCLRWLDWIFLEGYLPSLTLSYVGMSKDMGKRLPQLYYIKMKISYDLGFSAIGVAMAT